MVSLKEIFISTLMFTSTVFNLNAIDRIEASHIEQVLQSFQSSGGKINGTLLVAEGKKVIFSRGYGIADEKSNKNNNVNTQFLIGSITKQFTAAALLKSFYVQEKLRKPEISEEILLENIKTLLHKPLSAYIAEEDPIWEGEAPDWLNTVTLHHLLCHTSGIPNYTAAPSFIGFSKVDHYSIADIVSLFRGKDLEFPPGSKWNYSNSGYILLGIVVERINGIKIEAFFDKNFFTPFEMKSTFMPSMGRVEDFIQDYPNLAKGYAWDLFDIDAPTREQPMYENMLHAHAAGAIISTVEDLHRWNMALYENEEVFPKFLLELMLGRHALINQEEANIFYSYGLAIQQEPYLPLVGHDGGIPGYFSVLRYYPQQRISLVTLQNITPNVEQQVIIQEELEEKFSYLKPSEEHDYLQEKYPLLFQQEKTYYFVAPLCDYFEKQWEYNRD